MEVGQGQNWGCSAKKKLHNETFHIILKRWSIKGEYDELGMQCMTEMRNMYNILFGTPEDITRKMVEQIKRTE
jgi:hypothetical protein